MSIFEEKTVKFETAVDLYYCLTQFEKPISVHTCEPISELPSNMITMTEAGRSKGLVPIRDKPFTAWALG